LTITVYFIVANFQAKIILTKNCITDSIYIIFVNRPISTCLH